MRKLVVSTTLGEPGWRNTAVLPDADPGTIRAAVSGFGGETVCTGSIRLTHALLSADLVDELRLYTYPAVQGRGRRLFPDGWARPTVRLLDAESFAGGVTYRSYSFR